LAADGYRAAGDWVRREIQRLSVGCPRTPLERDIRDTEIEARTLARVVLVAQRLVARLEANDPAADGVRELVGEFIARDDLPTILRRPVSLQSGTRLTSEAPSQPEIGRRRRSGTG
jgi:hypothetical protein